MLWARSETQAIPGRCSKRQVRPTRGLFDLLESRPDAKSVLSGLFDLSQPPWTVRVWVVQEVFAASEISVQCGNIEMDWETFTATPRVLEALSASLREIQAPEDIPDICNGFPWFQVDRIASMVKFLSVISSPENSYARLKIPFDLDMDKTPRQLSLTWLHQFLQRGNHLLATDDRDRVFALIGIATQLASTEKKLV